MKEPSVNELAAQFRDPGAAYRGKPFWSWNGALDEAELLRQIDIMQEMGLGGFFMHSRTGLCRMAWCFFAWSSPKCGV